MSVSSSPSGEPPTASEVPLSVSRTIPIQLTSDSGRSQEVHLQQVDHDGDLEDVSEVSQSVAHVIQIKRLNRPSSMYQPKLKEEDETDAGPDPETREKPVLPPAADVQTLRDELLGLRAPEQARIAKPLTPKLDMRKLEAAESVNHVFTDKNCIAITAVGIITECPGDALDSTSEEASSSKHVDAVKRANRHAEVVDDVLIRPKKPSLRSVESASSQFDVSEIPLDLVEVRSAVDGADSDSSVFEQPIAVSTPADGLKHEQEDELQPLEGYQKRIETVYSRTPETAETSPAAEKMRGTASAPVLDAETELERVLVEEMEHAARSKSPSPDPDKVFESIEVVPLVRTTSDETASSSFHYNKLDTIKQPATRPVVCSAATVHQAQDCSVRPPVASTGSIEIKTEYLDPMDDPDNPEYRPVIHQGSFEIPIIFDDTPQNISLQRRFVPLPPQPDEDEEGEGEDGRAGEDLEKLDKDTNVDAEVENEGGDSQRPDDVKIENRDINKDKDVKAEVENEGIHADEKDKDVDADKDAERERVIRVTFEAIPKGALDEVHVAIPVLFEEPEPVGPPRDGSSEENTESSVEAGAVRKDVDAAHEARIKKCKEVTHLSQLGRSMHSSQYEGADGLVEDVAFPVGSETPENDEERTIPVTADVEEFKANLPRSAEISVLFEDDDVQVEVEPVDVTVTVDDRDKDVESAAQAAETVTRTVYPTESSREEEDDFVVVAESSQIPVDEAKVRQEKQQQQQQQSIEEAISGITRAAAETTAATSQLEPQPYKKMSDSSDNGFVMVLEEAEKPSTSSSMVSSTATVVAAPLSKEESFDHEDHSRTPERDPQLLERKDSFDVSNMKAERRPSEGLKDERRIPEIVETRPDLDPDDIDIVIEDATPERDPREGPQREKPSTTTTTTSSFVVMRKKDRPLEPEQAAPPKSKEDEVKPTVVVAPQTRTPAPPQTDSDKKTRTTSVIRTDENDDSEAPLIRVKRREFEAPVRHPSPEKRRQFPTSEQTISESEEIANKFRQREAKLMERLSLQSTQEQAKSAQKPVETSKFFRLKTEQVQHRLSPTTILTSPPPPESGRLSSSGSIHKDLREANLELAHSPKSPSPSRTDDSLSPRTLTRINNLNVIFENGKAVVDGNEVIHHHPIFVKDTSKYWYKPTISREDAIGILRDKPSGTFVVRDSNSFPGAFGLALKVAKPPEGVPSGDGTELVRHFLIEPSNKGVKLKGCNNEPVFGTLAALVYQHSITPMALPCRLILPEYDPASSPEHLNAAQALLEQGAACNVSYIYSVDTESLTGPEAIRKTVREALEQFHKGSIRAVNVHFKVSAQGITLTDNTRSLFFRRHYTVQSVIFAGIDPEDRKWDNNNVSSLPPTYVRQAKIYGFVARKVSSRPDNACHIFAELDPEQPASAVVNFITKVMMGQNKGVKTLPQ